ncbi:MAG TPA: peptide-methionine (S)-S-oxide reductase MsrA [Thermomicrobiales bacterium]|nr:peptide-methionine (S)-S-oxide reductase MsrA [Thermomicrobiales bacterium]
MSLLDTLFGGRKTEMIDADQALPGSDAPRFAIPATHAVLGTPIQGPFPQNLEIAYFGLGCFWGAERLFWKIPGVYTTAAGYMGGYTPNPTYEEVCSSKTGHTETVMVVFDPAKVSYADLLKTFFEEHDPTQGMRQGNDWGTQYRSAIFTTSDEQATTAREIADRFAPKLKDAGYGQITTDIEPAGPFYYAEDYHQQYLHKVPNGYCGLSGTGVSCPVPWATQPVSGGSQELDVTHIQLPQTDEEWRQRLTPMQYHVLREAGTERPFTGEYVDTETEGLYRCAACGNQLFDSNTKFHSGCGWPSFTEALPGAVEYLQDTSHGMTRTEVRCAKCHSHLGHVFPDGPRSAGGNRFCMNSVSLDLIER